MTRAEIQRKHQEIVKRRKELNLQMRELLLEWQQLQLRCEHKNKYQTSAMGELGTRCPDCGYST